MAGALQRARYLVLEALYEAETSNHDPEAAYERRIAAMEEEDPEVAAAGPAGFGRGIIRRVWAAREELDEAISAAAPRFPVGTLAVIDRNILRLAIWELRSGSAAPAGAVINEAIELARRYGGDRSPAFVHGVLGTVTAEVGGSGGDGAANP